MKAVFRKKAAVQIIIAGIALVDNIVQLQRINFPVGGNAARFLLLYNDRISGGR